MTEVFHVFVDGSCRYQKFMAIGIYNATTCEELSIKLKGRGSANIAEYLAVKIALRIYKNNGVRKLVIYSDSQVVVNQLCGKFAVTPQFKKLYDAVKVLAQEFEEITFVYIPRTENTKANWLAQKANGYTYPH